MSIEDIFREFGVSVAIVVMHAPSGGGASVRHRSRQTGGRVMIQSKRVSGTRQSGAPRLPP